MDLELVVKEKNNCIINGLLTRDYVRRILVKGDNFISSSDTPVFDFSGIAECDSSSVALVVHWWRTAINQNKKVRFINYSPKMLAIMRISEVNSLLEV
jgi:ABC-type transporter Mla MlaB component